MSDRKITIKINADGTAAIKGIKSVGDATDDLGKRSAMSRLGVGGLESGISKLAMSAAAAAGAFLGASGIVSALRNLTSESAKVQTNLLRTESLLIATGNAAGFSAQQLRDQARDLAYATLQSTDGVERAQQVMLTFRSVTGDTFTRAMELATDTATVFGGLESATTQIGKALESPVQGIGALTRVGVSFSESQKEMIKSLVETGDQLGAQTIILDTLAGQLGGIAAAEAAGFAGAQDSMGQAAEEARLALADQMGLVDKATAGYQFMTDRLWILVNALGYDLPQGARSALDATGATANAMRWLGETIADIPAYLAGASANLADWSATVAASAVLLKDWGVIVLDTLGLTSDGFKQWVNDLIRDLDLTVQAFLDLPNNLRAIVTIMLAELDVFTAGFDAAMQALPIVAQKVWLAIENAVRASVQALRQIVADGVAWMSAKLGDLARSMAGYAESVPALLDIGGRAAATAVKMTALAERMDKVTNSAAELRAEGDLASQQHQQRQAELNQQLAGIDAERTARVGAYREIAAEAANDAIAASQSRQARAAEAKAQEQARIESEKLARQTRETTDYTSQAAATSDALSESLSGAKRGGGGGGGQAGASREAAAAARELQRAQQSAISTTDGLVKRYLPAKAAVAEYAKAQQALAVAVNLGKVSQQEAGQILEKMRAEMDQAAAQADRDAGTWATVWEGAVKRVDDAFANLWVDLFEGTSSTLESLKKGIMRWLAEVAHMLTTQRLTVAIGASMGIPGMAAAGTSAAGAAGASGGGLSGMLSGIGGWLGGSSIGSGIAQLALGQQGLMIAQQNVGLGVNSLMQSGFANLAATSNLALGIGGIGGLLAGSFLGNDSQASKLGNTIGSTAGTVIGAAIGGPVGAVIGGTVLGGLGSLFGSSKSKPNPWAAIDVAGGNLRLLNSNEMDSGAIRQALDQFNRSMDAVARMLGDAAVDWRQSANQLSAHLTSTGSIENAISAWADWQIESMIRATSSAEVQKAGSKLLGDMLSKIIGEAGNNPQAAVAGVAIAKQLYKNLRLGVDQLFVFTADDAMFSSIDHASETLWNLARSMQASGETAADALTRVMTAMLNLTVTDRLSPSLAGMQIDDSDISRLISEKFGGLDRDVASAAADLAKALSGEMQSMPYTWYREEPTGEWNWLGAVTERVAYTSYLSQRVYDQEAIDAARQRLADAQELAEITERVITQEDIQAELMRRRIEIMERITDLAGGAEALAELQSRYYEAAFTEAERAQATLDFARAKLADFNRDLGSSVYIDTTAELRDYIESLDLTSNAGQAAYVKALRQVEYLQAIDDALAILADGEDRAGKSPEDLIRDYDALIRRREDAELKLLELEAGREAALLARRERELAGADEVAAAILRRIYAVEDEITAIDAASKAAEERARLAEQIAQRRAGIELKLLELSMGAEAALAETRRREMEAADASLRPLLERQYALEDEARAAAAAAQRAEEIARRLEQVQQARAQVELRLIELTRGAAARLAEERRREIAAADDSLQPMLARVYALEDEAAALEQAARALEARAALEIRLLRALGQEAAATARERARELAAAEPLNRAILMQIYAAEDAAKAREEQLARERESIASIADARIAALNSEREAAQAALSAAESALGSITGAISTLRGQQQVTELERARAARQLAGWAAAGRLPDQDELDRVIATLTRVAPDDFASESAFRVSQATTLANLVKLEQVGEREVNAAQAAVDRLDRQIQQAADWREAQLASLDAMAQRMTGQLGASVGALEELRSIDSHLDNLTAPGAAAPAIATDSPREQLSALRDLCEELITLRSDISKIGAAQIIPIKAIEDRLRAWDLEGQPGFRDDGNTANVLLLQAG